MNTITIAARDIQVGDEIFNSLATSAPFQWVRVLDVNREHTDFVLEGGALVKLPCVAVRTMAWTTMLHLDEGIAVRRES